MATPLSMDLRVRVLASVEAGLSHRQAAERFGVSAASVWHRPHGGIKAMTPISKLGLSEENLLRIHS